MSPLSSPIVSKRNRTSYGNSHGHRRDTGRLFAERLASREHRVAFWSLTGDDTRNTNRRCAESIPDALLTVAVRNFRREHAGVNNKTELIAPPWRESGGSRICEGLGKSDSRFLWHRIRRYISRKEKCRLRHFGLLLFSYYRLTLDRRDSRTHRVIFDPWNSFPAYPKSNFCVLNFCILNFGIPNFR